MQLYLRKIIYPLLLCFICVFIHFFDVYASSNTKVSIVFIPDVNLYPTPVSTIRTKSLYESKNGLLVYESQAILQEVIRYINQKLSVDYVVFGGNNILDSTDVSFSNYANISGIDLWHLFLDMISELKPKYFFTFGQNELKLNNFNELVYSLNTIDVKTSETWWYKKDFDKNILFVGLDTSLFSVSPSQSMKQLKWLNALISNNPDFNILIFGHDSLIDPNGKVLPNKYSTQVFKLIKQSPNVMLYLSGGLHLNRIRKANQSYLVVSSSSIAYPCNFKLLSLSDGSLSVESVKIPLKGIIKKAEKSLLSSDFTIMNFVDSPKSVIDYVLGAASDNDLRVAFSFK